MEHLCIFGCNAYAHIPKDEWKKLDSKSKKCILVGYGQITKGYKLLEGRLCTVVLSFCNETESTNCKEDKYETQTKDETTRHLS